jgi:ABC-type phosphate/phosphonate transport system substrate-binding protein
MALGAATLLLATGCGGDASNESTSGTVDTTSTVTLEPGERAPAIEGATARFAAPAQGAVLDS